MVLLHVRSMGRATLMALAAFASAVHAQSFDDDDSYSQVGDEQQVGDWSTEPPPDIPQGDEPTQQYAEPESSGLEFGTQLRAPSRVPTMDDFDRTLSPYGTWIIIEGLGRVWQPSPAIVGNNFVPYVSSGSWARVGDRWAFRSAFSWGWAPFHYGRWHLEPRFGWVWWPDSRWAPAWVDWRSNPNYVAWTPLPPPGLQVRFTLGVPGWSFVPRRHFWRPSVSSYVIYPSYDRGHHSRGHHRGWGWSRQPRWHASTPVWQGQSFQYGGFRGGFERQPRSTVQYTPPPPPPSARSYNAPPPPPRRVLIAPPPPPPPRSYSAPPAPRSFAAPPRMQYAPPPPPSSAHHRGNGPNQHQQPPAGGYQGRR